MQFKFVQMFCLFALASAGAFAEDAQILKVSCTDEAGSTIVRAVLDLETGEQNSFKITDGSNKLTMVLTHVEDQPDAMQNPGALMEIFAEGIDEDTSAMLAILNDYYAGDAEASFLKATGILTYGFGSGDDFVEKSLLCELVQ